MPSQNLLDHYISLLFNHYMLFQISLWIKRFKQKTSSGLECEYSYIFCNRIFSSRFSNSLKREGYILVLKEKELIDS